MRGMRLTGPGAGVEKYDLLTAMAVNGLAAGGSQQASMMRLIALVTARYNWALDEVSIGQKEMAQLWSVDDRTAKRETKRLVEAGLLQVKRPGVRGRVATYRLCVEEIYRQTEARWRNVGSDYEARMGARSTPAAPETPKVVRVEFGNRPRPEGQGGATPWDRGLDLLQRQNPTLFQAWFARLALAETDEGQITIRAPSQFVAQYIATHLLPALESAMSTAFGGRCRCIVTA